MEPNTWSPKIQILFSLYLYNDKTFEIFTYN